MRRRSWGRYAGIPEGRRRWVLWGAALVASAAAAFFQARYPQAPAAQAVPAPSLAASLRPGALVGVWVQERTILTSEGVRAAAATARRMGATALFVQVLARGRAAYRSSIWPPAVSPGGAGDSFDPLAAVIAEARREPRLEVHAWVNLYTWGELGQRPPEATHPLARHPDWVTVDQAGRSLWEYRINGSPVVNALFVDPGVEGVRQTMVETVQELVRRYDLDGIHLDYVRYPWAGAGYHPESLAAFWKNLAMEQVQGPAAPPSAALPPGGASREARRLPATPEERAAWNVFRARQVTQLVERIHSALQAEAPGIALTAAVLPDPRRAYEEALQEWPEWLARGLVSGVVLMSYTPSDAVVAQWVAGARRLAYGVPVYAGIGAYLLSGNPAQLVRQTRAALEAGAAGVVYYSFESLEADPALVEALSPAAGSAR